MESSCSTPLDVDEFCSDLYSSRRRINFARSPIFVIILPDKSDVKAHNASLSTPWSVPVMKIIKCTCIPREGGRATYRPDCFNTMWPII